MRRLFRSIFVVAILAAIITPVALALRFTDESYNIPQGVVGQPFSHRFDGAGGCGPGLPYQFRVLSGGLPPGLVLEKNGLLHGTPTQAGEWTFWVELSDEDPPSASWCIPAKAQREFTVTVIQGIQITSGDTPDGTVGTAYNFALSGSGTSSGSWSLAGGALPDGLTLGSNGVISGTPSKSGQFSFTVKLADSSRSATKGFKITVYDPLNATFAAKLPGAEVGAKFTTQAPAVTGGLGPYKWSASLLPAGLAIDAATGVVSGTPTSAGSFVLKLIVTDARGTTKEVDLTLVIAPKLKVLAPTKVKPSEVGLDYSLTITRAGGVEPLKWTVTGKPPGLTFDAATGELSGTPKLGGTYRVSVRATDALGAQSEPIEFDLKVARKLTITTTRLLGTKVGKQFSRQIATRGGAGRLTFKVTGGKLPVGVRLNTATGAIVGVPASAGSYTFTVTVTDGLHAKSTQAIKLNVIA